MIFSKKLLFACALTLSVVPGAFSMETVAVAQSAVEKVSKDVQTDKSSFGAFSCCICMDTVENDHQIVLRCGHKFHEGCLALWRIEHGENVTCPECRAPAAPLVVDGAFSRFINFIPDSVRRAWNRLDLRMQKLIIATCLVCCVCCWGYLRYLSESYLLESQNPRYGHGQNLPTCPDLGDLTVCPQSLNDFVRIGESLQEAGLKAEVMAWSEAVSPSISVCPHVLSNLAECSQVLLGENQTCPKRWLPLILKVLKMKDLY